MRRPGAVSSSGLAALAALAVGAPAAAAAPPQVSILFQAFSPSTVDALPGETVTWPNVSGRTHTVTADDGSFDSGELADGATFAQAFAAPGAFAYHCRIHPGMTGEVDVRPVILEALPPAAVPAGHRVELAGRTSTPDQPVVVERDTGKGFVEVASVRAAPDGAWTTSVVAVAPADYRARSDAGASETRRLLVTTRRVEVHATRTGIAVTVVPAAPYGRIQLQLRLRERFGWWPVATKRLDYVSAATFRVPHGVRARAVLVDRDGWTPLAVSSPVRR